MEVPPPSSGSAPSIKPSPSCHSNTTAFPHALRHEGKWRRSDSNRRPPACKAGALPLSYAPAGEDANSSTQAGQQRHLRATTPYTREEPNFAQQNLVGQGGLEPPTPRLSSVCSNQLSYWPRSCGVAQSGEGCAVGARRGLHHDQARRHGRYVSNNQETSVRGCPTPRSHPGPFGQARTKRCLVMSDVTQGPRKTRQADILERR